MLSVAQALEHVLAQARVRPTVAWPLCDALGLVLAEEVTSDIDSPPHDKSIVDGYAVVAADLSGGSAELEILEEVTAGNVPKRTVTGGQATRIMTGAPIPAGADAVVMIERSQLVGDRVRLTVPRIASGDNIMRRASSMTRGQAVLAAGTRLRAIELGVLAEVGRSEVRVVERPSVAVLATGNELVRPCESPGAGQIRNSNGSLLMAAAQAAGASAFDLGIARDSADSLREAIARGLQRDMLVISGGVSAGVLDLVPGVLAELGVQQVFHKVQLKPGKPLWFGIGPSDLRPPASGLSPLIFGLPGNPVSSFVCFELFVRPAIGRMAGRRDAALQSVTARLVNDFSLRGDRPTYYPARLACGADQHTVEPLTWRGSGDLRTLVDANALAIFDPPERLFRAGETIRALRLAE